MPNWWDSELDSILSRARTIQGEGQQPQQTPQAPGPEMPDWARGWLGNAAWEAGGWLKDVVSPQPTYTPGGPDPDRDPAPMRPAVPPPSNPLQFNPASVEPVTEGPITGPVPEWWQANVAEPTKDIPPWLQGPAMVGQLAFKGLDESAKGIKYGGGALLGAATAAAKKQDVLKGMEAGYYGGQRAGRSIIEPFVEQPWGAVEGMAAHARKKLGTQPTADAELNAAYQQAYGEPLPEANVSGTPADYTFGQDIAAGIKGRMPPAEEANAYQQVVDRIKAGEDPQAALAAVPDSPAKEAALEIAISMVGEPANVIGAVVENALRARSLLKATKVTNLAEGITKGADGFVGDADAVIAASIQGWRDARPQSWTDPANPARWLEQTASSKQRALTERSGATMGELAANLRDQVRAIAADPNAAQFTESPLLLNMRDAIARGASVDEIEAELVPRVLHDYVVNPMRTVNELGLGENMLSQQALEGVALVREMVTDEAGRVMPDRLVNRMTEAAKQYAGDPQAIADAQIAVMHEEMTAASRRLIPEAEAPGVIGKAADFRDGVNNYFNALYLGLSPSYAVRNVLNNTVTGVATVGPGMLFTNADATIKRAWPSGYKPPRYEAGFGPGEMTGNLRRATEDQLTKARETLRQEQLSGNVRRIEKAQKKVTGLEGKLKRSGMMGLPGTVLGQKGEAWGSRQIFAKKLGEVMPDLLDEMVPIPDEVRVALGPERYQSLLAERKANWNGGDVMQAAARLMGGQTVVIPDQAAFDVLARNDPNAARLVMEGKADVALRQAEQQASKALRASADASLAELAPEVTDTVSQLRQVVQAGDIDQTALSAFEKKVLANQERILTARNAVPDATPTSVFKDALQQTDQMDRATFVESRQFREQTWQQYRQMQDAGAPAAQKRELWDTYHAVQDARFTELADRKVEMWTNLGRGGTPPPAQPLTPAPSPAPTAPSVGPGAVRPPAAPAEQAAETVAPQVADRIAVADIQVDPARFQFKLGTGPEGITPAQAKVKKWDPALGAGIAVWRDPANGKVYVVDGHHRVALAKRLGATDIEAPYMIQAPTAQDARAVGALRNIASGRGTPFDAAKFFRDAGFTADELAAQGLALSETNVRKGVALAGLHQSLFGAAVRGEIPIERAVIIGEKIPDQALQFQFVQQLDKEIVRGKKITDDVVSELADAVVNGPKETVTQADMFGSVAFEKSFSVERATLAANVRGRLAKDKRLFGMAAKNAEELGRVGEIDQAAAAGIASESGQLLEIFDRVKNQKGPIGDALNAAAARYGKGGDAAKVQDDVYEQIVKDLPEALRGGPGGGVAGSQEARLFGDAGRPPEAAAPTVPEGQPGLFGEAPKPVEQPDPEIAAILAKPEAERTPIERKLIAMQPDTAAQQATRTAEEQAIRTGQPSDLQRQAADAMGAEVAQRTYQAENVPQPANRLVDTDPVTGERRSVRRMPDAPGSPLNDLARANVDANQQQADILRQIVDAQQNAPTTTGLTPQARKVFQRWVNRDWKRGVDRARAMAVDIASRTRDHALLNYADRKNIDTLLYNFFPYGYWQTHTVPEWLKRIAQHPNIVSNALRFKRTMEETNKDRPEWYRMNFDLGPLLGMNEPMYMNALATLMPLYNLVGHDFNDPDKKSLAGKAFQAIGNLGYTPWTPAVWALALGLYARGDQEGRDEARSHMGYLASATKAFKGATALAGAQGGQGITVEPWLMDWAKGLVGQGFDKWDQNRMGPTLSAMQQRGAITPEESADAGYSREGPAWQQAAGEVMQGPPGKPWQGRALSNVLAWALGAGFKTRSAADEALAAANTEWRALGAKADDMTDKERSTAYKVFYEKYPFYDEYRLAQKGNEADSQLAYTKIVLNRLPPGATKYDELAAVGITKEMYDRYQADKTAAAEQPYVAGERAPDVFAGWSDPERKRWMAGVEALAGKVPEPSTAERAEWDSAFAAKDEMLKQAKAQFGTDIEAKEDAYFKLDDAARKVYRAQHPELPEFWEMKRQFKAANPVIDKVFGVSAGTGSGPVSKDQWVKDSYAIARERFGEDIWDLNDRYMDLPKGSYERRLLLAKEPRLKEFWTFLDVIKGNPVEVYKASSTGGLGGGGRASTAGGPPRVREVGGKANRKSYRRGGSRYQKSAGGYLPWWMQSVRWNFGSTRNRG